MVKLLRRRFRRILIDVDTQYDLVYRLDQYRDQMLRNIRRIIAWSRINHYPVISTAICRREVSCPDPDLNEDICIEGTQGQKKIRYTMLNSNVLFGPDNRLDLPRHLLTDYQQVIFEKRSEDPFEMPRADRLLSEVKADEFIVFGIGLETGIKHTVLGLLRRKKQVVLVKDAMELNGNRDVHLCLRKLEAKGARIISTADLAGQSHLHGSAEHQQPWHNQHLINARIG
ncbi:MAG: isochorismatase family protein [Sedimentisphaerales bacterium]|nr:isochorismatase family protein [Sedimentisphaerales bacterium]